MVPIDLILKGIMTTTSRFSNVPSVLMSSNRPDFQRDYDFKFAASNFKGCVVPIDLIFKGIMTS